MSDLHTTASRAIDARRQALAQAVVARQYQRRPELTGRYGKLGQARCVQDVAYHLAHLSVAIATASPALFVNYLAWSKVVLVARNVHPEDVAESLDCLAEVLRAELPGEAGALAAHYVAEAGRALPAAPADVPSVLEGDDPLAALARQYLQALLGGDRHAAGRLVLDAVAGGVPVRDVYLGVLQRAQQEVGRLWQVNRLSVAQEHFCTAATRALLSRLAPQVFATPRTGRSLLATCVGGELHDIGLYMVCDFFEMDGWDTHYLGANVPAPQVVEAVARRRPDVLAVSTTMVFHLPAVTRLIAGVRAAEACAGVPVLVGGAPFRLDPDLWRHVGADGGAPDAPGAVAAATRLLAGAGPGPSPGGRPDAGAVRLAGLTPPAFPPGDGDLAFYDEMSRLNNELSAAQRELAKRNAELAEADRTKDEFLAVLAHELRNPLAPIRNAARVLEARGKDDPEVRWAREVVDRQAQQLTRLVDDLLDLTRVARGKVQLRVGPIELAGVVARAVEASRPLVEERRHRLEVALPPQPLRLEADPARLQQVLANLLNNAAKYTEPGGRIELAAAREDGDVVVRVRDTGIGIAPAMLPRVFGLFAQAEDARQRAPGGLGIGLALVRSLVEMHRGTVQATSPGLGRGSEFVVRLPALPERPEPAAGPPPAERPPGPAAPRRRILVVDDNVDAADTLALLLRVDGHEVRVVYDGEAALAAVAAGPPDVVLMDIGLPRLDGYEVARHLRQQPGLRGLVLIALTGWGQEEDRRRSREAGFDHHLTKPVDPDDLQRLLADLGGRDTASSGPSDAPSVTSV